jgi:2,4-dienoyl-CoA reductase (NADPH2)
MSQSQSVTRNALCVTDAVHVEGGRIALQILQYGRYAWHPGLVAPSAIKAPINHFEPHELTAAQVEELVESFADCAALAQKAGYDGVEIMDAKRAIDQATRLAASV